MAETTVDRLNVKLGLDMSGLKKGLKKANKSLRSASKSMKDMGQTLTTSVSAPIGAAVAALGTLTQQTAKYAQQVQLASAQSGMAAEDIQELAFAAQSVSGASFGQVQDGLKELALRSAEAAEGTGEAQEAFQRLGISQSELSTLGTAQLFERVRESMQGLTQQQRILTSEQVFGGEAGENFVEVMGLSAEQLQQLRAEAQASGAVLSGQQVQALDAASLGFSQLFAEIKGVGRQLAASLVPILQSAVFPAVSATIDLVRGVIRGFQSLSTTTKTIIAVLTGLAAAAGPLLVALGTLGTLLSGLPALFSGIAAAASTAWAAITGPVGIAVGALAAVGGVAYLIISNWSDLKSFFGGIWNWIRRTSSLTVDYIGQAFRYGFQAIASVVTDIVAGIVRSFAELAERVGATDIAETLRGSSSAAAALVTDGDIEATKERGRELQAALSQALSDGLDNTQEWGGAMIDSVTSTAVEIGDTISSAFSFTPTQGTSGGTGIQPAQGGSGGSGGRAPGLSTVQGAGLQSIGGMRTIGQMAQDLPSSVQRATAAMQTFASVGKKAVRDVASGFGDAIAGALTFQEGLRSAGDIFKAFGQVALQVLRRIISQLVTAAIISQIIPGSGSFGSVFKSLAVPGLAEGGVVTGPTLAVVGEGRESEAVLPLSKLNSMIQGAGTQRVVIEPRVLPSGDITFAQREGSRRRTRVGRG